METSLALPKSYHVKKVTILMHMQSKREINEGFVPIRKFTEAYALPPDTAHTSLPGLKSPQWL